MVECRDFTHLIKVQQDWVNSTVRDYLDEARKLTEITTHAVQDGMSSWQEVAQKSASVDAYHTGSSIKSANRVAAE